MTAQFVIAGLDPAIHRTEEKAVFLMDARVKPAHDESWILRTGITHRNSRGDCRGRDGSR
jgi:hypothetical protein